MAETTQSNVLLNSIAKAVASAMTKSAAREDTKLSVPAVKSSQPVIRQEVKDAVAATPEFQHVTNTEPWYTKRTRWSAIIGPSAMVIGIAMKFAGIDYGFGLVEQGLLADGLTAIGTLIAGWFAYSAGVATKPLGS